MLVVKVELWPHGQESQARTLGTIRIANDGTGTPRRGNYDYAMRGGRHRMMKTGRITDYARQAYNPWELVRRILQDWKG